MQRNVSRARPPTHDRSPPVLSAARKRFIKKRRNLVTRYAEEVRTKTVRRGKTNRSQMVTVSYKPYPNARAIVSVLLRAHGIKKSMSTVARDLRSVGFHCRSMPTGPLRVVGDPVKRVLFSNIGLSLALSVLRRLRFSDEKVADPHKGAPRRDWTRGEPMRRSRDQGAPRVMFWGVVGLGVRALVVIDGTLTQESYIKQCLRPNKALIKSGVFQYDNAKAHKGIVTRRWLKQNNVTTVHDVFNCDWPARSPDLSPIETVWSICQQRVFLRHHPLTRDEVIQAWQTEFYALEQHTVDELVLSFSGRLRQCVAAHGATITPT